MRSFRDHAGDAAAKRRLIRERSNVCEACGWAPLPFALRQTSMINLHHVIPVALGGTNEPDNLVLLCPNCHTVCHAVWALRSKRTKLEHIPKGREELLAQLKKINTDPHGYVSDQAWSLASSVAKIHSRTSAAEERVVKEKMYRQGDVLIKSVADAVVGVEVPRDELGRIVLAHGEATGHAHAISDVGATLFDLAEPHQPGDRLLRVTKTVALRHDEHSKIRIPPGKYIVRRQREYSPKEIRRVAD